MDCCSHAAALLFRPAQLRRRSRIRYHTRFGDGQRLQHGCSNPKLQQLQQLQGLGSFFQSHSVTHRKHDPFCAESTFWAESTLDCCSHAAALLFRPVQLRHGRRVRYHTRCGDGQKLQHGCSNPQLQPLHKLGFPVDLDSAAPLGYSGRFLLEGLPVGFFDGFFGSLKP